MALFLYSKKKQRGREVHITSSRSSPPLEWTKSVKSTTKMPVLFFPKKDYRGKPRFMSGAREIDNFRGSVFKKLRSIRIEPFFLHLNITVITDGGTFPGSWTSEDDARSSIETAVSHANDLWNRTLLQFVIKGDISCEDRPGKFNVRRLAPTVPMALKKPRHLDIMVVQTIGKKGTDGKTRPPGLGKGMILARGKPGDELTDDNGSFGWVLAHEIGHYVGIHAASAPDARNLMTHEQPATFEPETRPLTARQIEKVHRKLARSVNRRRDRHLGP